MQSLWLLPLVALFFGVTDSVPQNQAEKPNQVRQNLKAGAKVFMENINDYRLVLRPFLNMIPVWGPLVSAILDLPLAAASIAYSKTHPSVLNEIPNQIKDLKVNINDQHAMQMMAASPLQQYAANIAAAWGRYQVYIKEYLLTNSKIDFKTQFRTFYSQYETEPDKLSNLLAQANFKVLLAENSKCHDNELIEFIIWANNLLFFGNTMTRLYHQLDKSQTPALLSHIDKMTYDASAAMFQVRRDCLAKLETTVKNDLNRMMTTEVRTELREKKKTLHDQAHEIRNFFDKTYKFFDWFIVLYHSSHVNHCPSKNKCLKTLETFWTDKNLNVGVHWQLKGTNKHSSQIHKGIVSCVPNKTPCKDVNDKLLACDLQVGKFKVSEWISAVHIYHGQENLSLDGKATTSNPNVGPGGTLSTFYYRGECKGHLSTYTVLVMLKSDEQATQKNDCVGRDCGHGTCKLENQVGLCECQPGYWGQRCEEKLRHYVP